MDNPEVSSSFDCSIGWNVMSSEPPPSDQHSTSKNSVKVLSDDKGTLLERWFPDSISVYTLFLVIFTGALAFGAIYQLKLLVRAERIAAETAIATKDAANAATKAAGIAERAFKAAERANISVGNWGYINIGVGLVPVISYKIGNTGRTQATLIDKPTIVVLGSTLPETPTYHSAPANAIIPPGGGFVTAIVENPSLPPLEPDQFTRLITRQIFFFVYGRLTFRDEFEDVWDLGFVIRIEADTAPARGQAVFRDVVPDIPGFTYLRRHHS
jgi:hypothetical protein